MKGHLHVKLFGFWIWSERDLHANLGQSARRGCCEPGFIWLWRRRCRITLHAPVPAIFTICLYYHYQTKQRLGFA